MKLPNLATLREGPPDCPSDFTLDRLHASELPAALARETERHVAGCPTCAARMAERRAGFNALPGVDERALLARIRSGLEAPAPGFSLARLREWLRRLGAPLALVAAALLAVVWLPRLGEEPGGTRLKGAPVLHVYRSAGDHAEEMLTGSRFSPGDRLRFAVDLPTEGHVSIVGIEASGTLYTAWPLEPDMRTRLPAGQGQELAGAVSLDEKPGREVLYLVHCPVEAGPPKCASAGADAPPVCAESCVLSPFVLEKQP